MDECGCIGSSVVIHVGIWINMRECGHREKNCGYVRVLIQEEVMDVVIISNR